MGTRSKIGVKTFKGILSAYCHWDGHPESMAPILKVKYNTQGLAEALISGGSMSTVECDQDWEGNKRVPQPLYHSERGDGTPAKLYKRPENFSECFMDEEFVYLFKGKWVYKPANTKQWLEL